MRPPGPRGPEMDPFKKRLAVIAQNLRDLMSRDPVVSANAAERLKELAPTAGELLQVVNDRDQLVRAGAARLLRKVTDEDDAPIVTEALRGVLHASSDRVVIEVLNTLAALRSTRALGDVRAFLDEPNPRVQQAVVSALAKLGGPEDGLSLVKFVSSGDQHVMLAALQAAVALRCTEAVPAIVEQLQKCQGVLYRRNRSQFDVPRKLINALVALGAHEAVPVLVRIAQEEVGLRSMAVQALIHLKSEVAAPPLLPLLARLFDTQNEEQLTASLMHLFVVVDYRFALPEVRRFLTHRLPSVRIAALKAVASWGDLEVVERVRSLCHTDLSAFVRPQAVVALGRLLGPAALPDLTALVNDSNPLVREAIARVLGRMQPLPDEGRDLLGRLLEDSAAARSARNAVALQEEAAGQPLVLPVIPPSGPLPADLMVQANAARAFLLRWQQHLTEPETRSGPGVADLLAAIGTLLGPLRPKIERTEGSATTSSSAA
jgi:HEAT repeat protein